MPTGFSTVAPRVIYLVRNPKDVVVSYMHHMTLFKIDQFEGDLEDMVRHPLTVGCHPNHQSVKNLSVSNIAYNCCCKK